MVLDFLQINELTIEEKSNSFFRLIKDRGTDWLESELIKFFTVQNQRAERGEISTETIKNYLKPVKMFCEMNGIIISTIAVALMWLWLKIHDSLVPVFDF